MDERHDAEKTRWISSLEIIDKTGISRATLNNYIKMNILPRPDVKKPGDATVRARMLGYFPEAVINIIEQIKILKKKGYSMEFIIKKLKIPEQTNSPPSEAIGVEATKIPEDVRSSETSRPSGRIASGTTNGGTNAPLNVTINDIRCPAYLLNNSFEIDWVNGLAEEMIFQQKIRTVKEPTARNIFRLLMRHSHEKQRSLQEFFEFHLSFLKARMAKSDLDRLYEGISLNEAETLKTKYDRVETNSNRTVNKAFLKLYDHQGEMISDAAYYMIFREGTLFIHAPVESSPQQGITDLFSCRSKVINDLLRQRMPTLVSFCVLVADLQNSVRICAELPPEEYFELINQIWACVEGSFKQHYGTYGKHTGDGMLYYFLKERDNQYMMNAVSCALEIRENIRKLNMEWKIRRGWFNELYLNIGINEGQEYFGTIPSAPSVEFTALGDSVNYAGRLSDFARYGAIWTTKNLMNKLTVEEKEGLRYGIRRMDQEREILVENSFSRVIDMISQDNVNTSKFMDIATLAVTEILGRR
jgi:class 3 adenylate cyclase/DNA-binding transcriptional MerR regulator